MTKEIKEIQNYTFVYTIYDSIINDSDRYDKSWHYNYIREIVNDAIINGINVLNIEDINETDIDGDIVSAFYEFIKDHEDKFIIIEPSCLVSERNRGDLVDDDIIGTIINMDKPYILVYASTKTSNEVLDKF